MTFVKKLASLFFILAAVAAAQNTASITQYTTDPSGNCIVQNWGINTLTGRTFYCQQINSGGTGTWTLSSASLIYNSVTNTYSLPVGSSLSVSTTSVTSLVAGGASLTGGMSFGMEGVDGTTSYIAGVVNSGSSGYPALLQFTDGVSFNTDFGVDGSGNWQFIADRYPGQAGTVRASINKTTGAATLGNGSTGHATCWNGAVISYCTSVVDTNGLCTCH